MVVSISLPHSPAALAYNSYSLQSMSMTALGPLYQRDAACHELATKIVSCTPIQSLPEADRALYKGAGDNDHVITTEETIFHAQGGGQPSDIGEIKQQNNDIVFNVRLVRKLSGNQIGHLGSFSSPDQRLHNGDPVIQRIDSTMRSYYSRYHTAGHILGLAVKQLKDIVGQVSEVKANHAPGMAFVEFRGLIAGEHKGAIQDKATELVQNNLPVNVDWWDMERAQLRCAALPEGFLVPDDGNIRVVDVEGVGAYPCGGTHLPSTKDVGSIIVRKISRQKGITKISYEISDC